MLHCECGFEARAEDEDRLVAEVTRHAWEVHATALSYEDALSLARRAQPNKEAPPTFPRETTARTNEEAR